MSLAGIPGVSAADFDAMPEGADPESPYFIAVSVASLSTEERRQLEADIKASLDGLFGDEWEAALALFVDLDALALRPGERHWGDAEAHVAAKFGDRLVGGSWNADINWPVFQRPV